MTDTYDVLKLHMCVCEGTHLRTCLPTLPIRLQAIRLDGWNAMFL